MIIDNDVNFRRKEVESQISRCAITLETILDNFVFSLDQNKCGERKDRFK